TLKAGTRPADDLAAQKYLKEAVRLDPKFALGWALLSYVDADGYRSNTLPPTVALREEARQAAETALTLQPNLGEAILAKGRYHYSCLRDYDTAVRYFEQARQLLPNNSRIFESLAFLERRRGHWDRSESYFNEAEQLDPRNVHLLTHHAETYKHRRRFPEALRKFDQVLNITPDDVDTLALKASIAQAEGDLPRAAALLAPLHPNADNPEALVTQVYQAILERHPAQIIPRLEEILAKSDPALGYTNGELRFWLGWAQEIAGDHAAAQESWRQARSELESFLKEQPESPELLEDLALTNMGLGDKAAAFKLIERAIAANPIEKDALSGPESLEIFARVAAQMGEPDRAITALQKLLLIPYGCFPAGALTPALLRLDPMFDPLRNDPRFQKLVATGIAVLPFENRSEDKANAYFAEGIQDEILTRLSKIADLKVISRTSTQHYKSAPENLPEIARQLGVAHILEGSVQKSGDTVRVNVQLIKAANDSHLWADTFDRKLTDIFSVETEVATKIAETLQAKLTGAERNAIAARPTENTHAYQLYLKGRFFWNKRTGENLKKAADYFDQAIAADPNYALAYAGLAGVYVLMPFYSVGAPRDCYPRAKAAAKKALEQEDALAEAHTALAQVHCYYDFDFSQATSEFQRAIELNPNYATAHQWYGNSALVALGRFDEAIAEVKRAIELDPLSLVINTDLGATYYRARRYDEAIEQLHKTLELDPGFYYARWNLGSALSAKGAIGEAIGEYQKARALNDDPLVLGLLTRAYAFSGNKTEAIKLRDQLATLFREGYVSAYSFALVSIGFGDKEEALRWLEKSYQYRAGNDLEFIRVEPLLDPLRGDPRFEALMAKVFSTQKSRDPSP
ncbi:MAG: hypothetical protein DME50_05265, partial [Verrucomicrobia bacterium]